MTTTNTIRFARLEKHMPKVYNGLTDMARPFYTVRCDECLVVLNSGHYYYEHETHLAQLLADRHNVEVHRVSA